MKKNLFVGLILAVSVSFNANAGMWDDAQTLFADFKAWRLAASKPSKPEW